MVSSLSSRPSKFIESLPSTNHTQHDTTHDSTSPQTPTNDLFFSILSEMDEFEVRRQQSMRNRGTSQSSLDSLPSNTSSSPSRTVDRSHTVKEGNRRSINFTRTSLDKELDRSERRRSGSGSEGEENGGDNLARKFVGRLRALTGGREKDGKR